MHRPYGKADMKRFAELFMGMLGAAPKKPEKISESVQNIMVLKYADKDRYIKEKLHARRILCKHTVFLSYID